MLLVLVILSLVTVILLKIEPKSAQIIIGGYYGTAVAQLISGFKSKMNKDNVDNNNNKEN